MDLIEIEDNLILVGFLLGFVIILDKIKVRYVYWLVLGDWCNGIVMFL